MEETAYKIKLPLFEGPLDLLLHLIRENKIDIYDIPISIITRQYLEYLKLLKELNLEVAGEFLVMAATLIHIKSRMLLPIEETADTEELQDPRLELVMKLLEYRAFKETALGLKEREDEWSEAYCRIPSPEDEEAQEEDAELSLFDLNLFDLITAFQKLLDRAPAEVRLITKETLTVKDRMTVIIDRLQSLEAMRFEELFKDDEAKPHFIVTFVALLELIRLGIAKVYQEKEFGSIWVINPGADASKESIVSKMGGSVAPAIETEAEPAPSALATIEEEETSGPHPYDDPYEFDEGHPYDKEKPFVEARQFEDSHPYGESVLTQPSRKPRADAGPETYTAGELLKGLEEIPDSPEAQDSADEQSLADAQEDGGEVKSGSAESDAPEPEKAESDTKSDTYSDAGNDATEDETRPA